MVCDAVFSQQELELMTGFDPVENPRHYKGRFGLEAIDVHKNFMSDEELRGYYKGNVLKYLLRERHKNGLEDLKKAKKHLEFLIEHVEGTDKEHHD